MGEPLPSGTVGNGLECYQGEKGNLSSGVKQDAEQHVGKQETPRNIGDEMNFGW